MSVTIGFWLRLGAFFAAIAACLLLANVIGIGWGSAGMLIMLVVVIGAGTAEMMRFSEREQQRLGALSPALRRYNRRFAISTMIYLLGLFAAIWLFQEQRPAGHVAWLIPLLPSAGALAMLCAMVSLLREETDEYIRARLVRQWLFGGGVLLVLATVWGFFEQFGMAPHVPSWVAFPVFAVGMSFAMIVKERRA